MTRFIIFRHGETDWNVENRLTGWTDIPMNTIGRDQAHKLADRLGEERINVMYTSGSSRAHETAKIVNTYHNKTITIFDDLKELTYGTLEGVTKAERQEKYPWFRWSNDDHRKQFQMESIETWIDKLQNHIIPEFLDKHADQTVVLSTHHGKMKVILHVLGFDKKILDTLLPNCAFAIIEKDHTSSKIISYHE